MLEYNFSLFKSPFFLLLLEVRSQFSYLTILHIAYALTLQSNFWASLLVRNYKDKEMYLILSLTGTEGEKRQGICHNKVNLLPLCSCRMSHGWLHVLVYDTPFLPVSVYAKFLHWQEEKQASEFPKTQQITHVQCTLC